MKTGFLTSLIKDMSFKELVEWAKNNDFEYMEIAAWPKGYEKICKYYYATIDIDTLTEESAAEYNDILEQNSINISSFAYYDNNLEPDKDKRDKIHTHLKKIIDTAGMMGEKYVGTFIGRNPNLNISENINEAVEVFKELVDYAAQRNVKLMIENCPMLGWQKEGLIGNVFFAPFLWEEIFGKIESDYFGINFDPSHLIWQEIDYCRALEDFSKKVFHFHAKDTRVIKDKLHENGIYSDNWWEPVIPDGGGNIDWKKVIKTLKNINYKGAISIELEDEDYEMNVDKVREGLIKSNKYLSSIIKKKESNK